MKRDDGGPAFPTTEDAWNAGLGGVSLRDYFAGKAFRGLMGSLRPTFGDRFGIKHTDKWICQRVARMVWQATDALLAERDRGEQEEES